MVDILKFNLDAVINSQFCTIRRVQILEIGESARASLDAASRVDVIMTFSRGEVLQTNHGDIVWCDSDLDAFSPCGVRIPADASARQPDAVCDNAFANAIDAAVGQACRDFVSSVRAGYSLSDAARSLVGLGRGLTPAGDDFLGGFLVVRHRRGIRDTVDARQTHAISRARLGMHMRGEGTRAEMRFVDALLDGADLDAPEAALRCLGHSSGHDFIRGARAAAEWS